MELEGQMAGMRGLSSMQYGGAALGSNGRQRLACRGWIPCNTGAQPWEVMEGENHLFNQESPVASGPREGRIPKGEGGRLARFPKSRLPIYM